MSGKNENQLPILDRQPDWVELRRAPFLYRAMDLQAPYGFGDPTPLADYERRLFESGASYAEINAKNGLFVIDAWECEPHDSDYMLDLMHDHGDLDATTEARLRKEMPSIWHEMYREFLNALRDGRARLFARTGSIANSTFVEIPADDTRGLMVTSWDDARAVTADGEALRSIYVAENKNWKFNNPASSNCGAPEGGTDCNVPPPSDPPDHPAENAELEREILRRRASAAGKKSGQRRRANRLWVRLAEELATEIRRKHRSYSQSKVAEEIATLWKSEAIPCPGHDTLKKHIAWMEKKGCLPKATR